MKQQKYLILHCTATPEGREVSADDIRRMHTAPKDEGGRGWRQVGYRRLFHLNGDISELVKNNENGYVESFEITNGAKGLNSIAEHWCYVGGVDEKFNAKDTRTDWQREALRRELVRFNLHHPDVEIIGHCDVANKACPSFDVQEFLTEIGIKDADVF